MLGLGPLGILLGGFLGRRRNQGGGLYYKSAKARDTRIANEKSKLKTLDKNK